MGEWVPNMLEALDSVPSIEEEEGGKQGRGRLYAPIIPAHGRWMQENPKLRVLLGYLVSSMPSRIYETCFHKAEQNNNEL